MLKWTGSDIGACSSDSNIIKLDELTDFQFCNGEKAKVLLQKSRHTHLTNGKQSDRQPCMRMTMFDNKNNLGVGPSEVKHLMHCESQLELRAQILGKYLRCILHYWTEVKENR